MTWHIVYMITNHDGSREYVVRQVEADSMMLAKQLADRERVTLKRERNGRGVTRAEFFDESTICAFCSLSLGSMSSVAVGSPHSKSLPLIAHAHCKAGAS